MRGFLITLITLYFSSGAESKQHQSTVTTCSNRHLQTKVFPTKVFPGKSTIKYTVLVQNFGTTPLDGYFVSINIPSGTDYVNAKVYPQNKVIKASVPPQSGGGVVLWEVPRLPARKTYKMIVEFSVGSCLLSANDISFAASGYQVLTGGEIQCQKTTSPQKVTCAPATPTYFTAFSTKSSLVHITTQVSIQDKRQKKTRYTCAPSSSITTNFGQYGPPGSKCDISFSTPLINPSVDECYSYCSLYGPTAQQLPLFFNYLPNTNPSISSPECFCCGSTCNLVPVNTQRRLVSEEESHRRLALADPVYGAYQVTVLATMSPTQVPTISPTSQPTEAPSQMPSSQPSLSPSASPSEIPTSTPSLSPSTMPSNEPSATPTQLPTLGPSQTPSSQPSAMPTQMPTLWPSQTPSSQPSATPTQGPTLQPSQLPSAPTSQPSQMPTHFPTTTCQDVSTVIPGSGGYPADPFGSVSGEHIVVSQNGLMTIMRRDGTVLLSETGSDFLSKVNLGPGRDTGQVDGRVSFDKTARRWYYSTAAFVQDTQSWVYLVVSNTSDPMGAWQGYALWPSADITPGKYFDDYQVLGYSKDKIVISSAVYAIDNTGYQPGYCVKMVVNKHQLLNQGILEVQYLIDSPRCYIFPVQDLNGERDEVFALNLFVDNNPYNALYVSTYTGLPPNVIETKTTISIPTWSNPFFGPYGPASSGDGNGNNIEAGTWFGFEATPTLREGKIHAIQSVGVYANSNARVGFRVYKLDASSLTIDSIDRFQTSSDLWYIYPSMAVDARGDLFVSYTFNDPLSAGIMYVSADNPQLSCQYTAVGNGGYPASQQSGAARWGDYTNTVEDPDHPGTFCAFTPFTQSAGTYAIAVSCRCPASLPLSGACDLSRTRLVGPTLTSAPSVLPTTRPTPTPTPCVDVNVIVDTQYSTPPDSYGAVGGQFIVASSNYGMTYMDRNGTFLYSQTSSEFLHSTTNNFSATFAYDWSDPRVFFDKTSQRWYFSCVNQNANVESWVVFAISKTADPTQGWNAYTLWPAADVDPLGTYFADYDVLGYSSDKIIISAAIYYNTGSPSFCSQMVINKSKLVAQGILDVQYFTEPNRCYFFPALDVNGESADATAVTLFDYPTGSSNNIYIKTFTGLPPNVQVVGKSLSIPAWQSPYNNPAPSGVDRTVWGGIWFGLDAGPVRQGNVLYIAQPVGLSTKNGFRVYQIDALSETLISTMQFSSKTDNTYIFPSIGVARDGSYAVGYSYSSPTNPYINAGMVRVNATGYMSCQTSQAGTNPYGQLGNQMDRWGDYSGTVEDPDHPGAFCTFQEFAYDYGGTRPDGTVMSVSCTCPQTAMVSCDDIQRFLF